MFLDKCLVDIIGIGVSFFELFFDNRICEDMGIIDNYCLCLWWKFIDLVYFYVYKVVKVVVIYIN